MSRSFLEGLVLFVLAVVSPCIVLTGCGGIHDRGSGGLVDGVLVALKTVTNDVHCVVYEIDEVNGPVTLMSDAALANGNPPGWVGDGSDAVGDNLVSSTDGHFFFSHLRSMAPAINQVVALRPDFSTGSVSHVSRAVLSSTPPWHLKYYNGIVIAYDSSAATDLAGIPFSGGVFGTPMETSISFDGQTYDGYSVTVSDGHLYMITENSVSPFNLHLRVFDINTSTGAITPLQDIDLTTSHSVPADTLGPNSYTAWIGVANNQLVAVVGYSGVGAPNHRVLGFTLAADGRATFVGQVDSGFQWSSPWYLGHPSCANGYWFVGVPSTAGGNIDRLACYAFGAGTFGMVGGYPVAPDAGVPTNGSVYVTFAFRDLVYYLSSDVVGPPASYSIHARKVASDGSTADPNVDGTHLLNFRTASFWRPLFFRQGRMLVHSSGTSNEVTLQRSDLVDGVLQGIQDLSLSAGSSYRVGIVLQP